MASLKHKILTLEDEVKIIKLINFGHSYDAISKTFDIGKSTIGDIKKNKDSIMKFVSTTESGSKVRKTMKTADNVAQENALATWVAGSKGWLDRLKHSHRIRRLKITMEKLSNNESAIEPFRIELLLRVINEKNLSSDLQCRRIRIVLAVT
ncbi:hypothetical protein J437_LFUL019060 [Ladona fulva]|uniref:HTH psq-type domain-containing protein n=1 Tax=Ladona fulva TaxID=123851 RepID=A0A8K0KTV4_LADFU|nr:hypothetical protein J437_LFUL019060 [Ladona fulva]